MSDQDGPWNDVATATPTQTVAEDNGAGPWDAVSGAQTTDQPSLWDQIKGQWKQAMSATPSGKIQNILDKTSVPVAEKIGSLGFPKTGAAVGTGMQMASDIGGAVGGINDAPEVAASIKSVFKAAPDLLNAGIKPTTVLKMTPAGKNPAQFGQELQDTLNEAGAIGKDASDTWQKMNALKNQAGQKIGDILQQIGDEANKYGAVDNPLAIDSKTALQPIYDGWLERAGSATTQAQNKGLPFEQVYNSLTQTAQKQGGVLSLDNIRDAMDEIGPMTHKGSEETQEAMSELYHALANTRDGMVQTIASNTKNPELAGNLLNANKEYSQYMRLMPDISKGAANYAVKQGLSVFQKYGGPQILRYATGTGLSVAGLEGIKKLADLFEGK